MSAPVRALEPVEYGYEKTIFLVKLVRVCNRPAQFRPPGNSEHSR